MDCLVMCGGQGTRLDSVTEKPLHEIHGRSLVDRVLDAVAASRAADVYAVTSPHTPDTRNHLEDSIKTRGTTDLDVIQAPGEGYVADLQHALDTADIGENNPALTVAADLPLLDGAALDRVLDVYDEGSLTVCVPTMLPEALGVTVDAAFEVGGRSVVPTGVNVVGGAPDDSWVSWDARFAVNVNYPEDAAVAERLLSGPPE